MDNKNLNNNINKARLLEAQAQYKLRTSSNETAHSIYPWMNHDYDYLQHVKNNYTPKKLGISDEPCVDVTINDGLNLPKFSEVAMFNAIPNQNSKAGVDDVDPTNPQLTALQNNYRNFKEPYPGFKKEYPEFFPLGLEGENSSSYFIQTGFCPTKIEVEGECKKKGFTWVPNPINMPSSTSKFFPGADKIQSMGGCHKPRYTYVNNKAGDISGLFKGLVPTIGKEIMELNPISFMSIIMSGQSPGEDFTPLPCKEGFTNFTNFSNNIGFQQIKLLMFLLIIILLILILAVFYKR